MSTIESFMDEYEFLSNFYCGGILLPSLEHHFQAAKTNDYAVRWAILRATTPGIAKKLGRNVELRPDWEDVKDTIMRRLVTIKFFDKPLGDKLIATGDAELIEGNTWHDNYWGICLCARCHGKYQYNKLGHIIMDVRAELVTWRELWGSE